MTLEPIRREFQGQMMDYVRKVKQGDRDTILKCQAVFQSKMEQIIERKIKEAVRRAAERENNLSFFARIRQKKELRTTLADDLIQAHNKSSYYDFFHHFIMRYKKSSQSDLDSITRGTELIDQDFYTEYSGEDSPFERSCLFIRRCHKRTGSFHRFLAEKMASDTATIACMGCQNELCWQ